ncbi:hypothetical protein [Vulcanisaeta sp. JCM 16161]|uniref:hypothetical protein n=1 Tax=Vulcanisaeta sp. JCM 16161 TaxID=1295372 RepID=UPI001FB565AC|nr:hypothetical protein [Vulcanisaeta sp. JCM 16161]
MITNISYSSVVFSDREVRGVFDDVATSVRLELLENRSLFRALVGGLLTPVNSLVRLWLRDVDAIICI